MDWARAKTIIITFLFLINIFLLGTYMVKENNARNEENMIRTGVSEILLERGIKVSAEIIPHDSEEIFPAKTEIKDDLSEEAEKLLGKVNVAKDADGTVYTGTKGNIMALKNSFSFVAKIDEKAEADEKNALSIAKTVTQKLSFPTDMKRAEISGNENGYEIKIPQIVSGVNIFNCGMEMRISPSGNTIGNGSFIGNGKLSHVGGHVMKPSALMLSLCDDLAERGIKSAEIEEISIGYTAKKFSETEAILTPTLKIKADCGTFYLNMQNGEIAEI